METYSDNSLSSKMAVLLLLGVMCFVNRIHSQRNAVDFVEDLSTIYSIKQPPAYVIRNSTEVRLGLFINDVYNLGDKGGSTLTMNIYLRINWQDPRLAFNPANYGHVRKLYLPDETNKKIWFPDVFFRNARDVTFDGLERENNVFLVNSTGHLRYIRKLTTTVSCHMDYQKYPFDLQTCDIQIESFRYRTHIMTLRWLYDPISADPFIQYPGFLLLERLHKDCTQSAFPCLKAELTFIRDSNQFYVRLFFPTILLVLVSWFSFWMEFNKYAERVCLLCVLLLSLTFIYMYHTSQLPYITQLTALDAWILICYCFISLPLIQATVFKMFDCNYDNKQKHKSCINAGVVREIKGCHSEEILVGVNLMCKITVPLLFLVAVIIYFSMCKAKY